MITLSDRKSVIRNSGSTRLLTVRTVILAWAFVPLVFFSMFRDGQVDPDLWWHLKAGAWMLEHGRVPHEELFSYTSPGQEWVAHEWLTEILFWKLYRLGGMWALVILQGMLAAGALWLAYLVARGVSGNSTAAAASAWLVGLACFPFFRVRPHLFTFVFLGMTFAFALFYVKGFRRVVWAFPVLILLWVNVHGGFVAGLGIGLTLLLYESVRCLFRRDVPPREARRRIRDLLAAAVLGVLAVVLNPNGARMWAYPFEYMGDSPYIRGILEWRAPDFATGEFFGFELLLLAGFVTLSLSRRRPHRPALLACVALLHQSLQVLRYIPFFALCFGPLLAWHLADVPVPALLRRRSRRVSTPVEATRAGREHPLLSGALLALLPVLLVYVVSAGLAEPALTEKRYPAAALRQMNALGIEGNLFHDYMWGGYLMFREYPRRRVFVDGRADAYRPGVIDDFLRVSRLRPGWREVLDRYHIRAILWPARHSLTEALKLDSAWELRYADEIAVLFTRRPPSPRR